MNGRPGLAPAGVPPSRDRTVLRSRDGIGHVLLDWLPAPGTAGYVVHRSDHYEGPYEPLHPGPVLPPYADTRAEPGRGYWYRIAPGTPEGPEPPLPGPVRGCALAPGSAPAGVRVRIDAGAPHRPAHLTGDGARALVTATVTARDGTVEVRVVNAAADRPRAIPVPALGRRVTVEVAGLEPGARYRMRPAGDTGPEAFAHTGPDGLVRTTLDLPMPGSRTLRLAPDRTYPHPAKEDPGP
ncbi:hypothetical protein AMK18_01475 [Streptomyces sp. CB01249]|uniref:hypothetical protein n=1 Tax=Streptomyces sp. CB01249 TaxID=1703929 RepID=UPI00093AF436|nr:hypothetical protein [Streptomyces sp. CB01249]OKJ03887.1 hypothetical protein AMK18_01475 [Streptomyces sp. CB01249]